MIKTITKEYGINSFCSVMKKFIEKLKKENSVHCKKSALAIAENLSLDFGLSITNGHGKARSVMDVNLCSLI